MKNRGHEFAETRPGDHVFFVYEDTSELLAFVVPFIKDGLVHRERCVYLTAESNPADIIEGLAAGGVRVKQETKRGAFVLTTAREFFALPPFDALRATERLLRARTEAAAAEFSGLRVAGDWAWSLAKSVQENELSEFEALLEGAVGPGHLTVACLYRKGRSDPAVLERLIRTHAKAVARDHVYLSLSALFQNLARTDLEALARSARERIVHRGGAFFRQGDQAEDVYFLTAGLVKLVRADADGRNVILRIVPPMQPFGERVLAVGNGVRLSSAEALEDSRALAWDSATLRQVVLSHPAVAMSAIRMLEERVESERHRIEDFASPDVRRRLARLLVRLGQKVGRRTRRGAVISAPLSRHDLAEMVITSPYTVSRILAEWRRSDILDVQRTRIMIRDWDRLAAIAAQPAAGLTAKSKIS